MAGKIKSVNTVTKETFTGTTSDVVKVVEQNAVNSPVKDIPWEASQLNTESKTHLEDDSGTGAAAIIRIFTFAANPEVFKVHKPTKQELFNYHSKFIEMMLWKDGMKVVPEVAPKILINRKKTKYRIMVGAMPQKGHILREQPQTLTEIAHA